MRRFTRPLVVGTLAFGLVAAAATGIAFTIDTVGAAPSTESATGIVPSAVCDGTYEVEWTLQFGQIVGMTATRTAPAPESDPNLAYCAEMPYIVQIGDGTIWSQEWSGNTEVDGDILNASTVPSSGWITFVEGLQVRITIGPDAYAYGAP